MRAMVRLANIYRLAGMDREYVGAMTTAVELFAGDRQVTFELINRMIDDTNRLRAEIYGLKRSLNQMGINPDSLSPDNLPQDETELSIAVSYLNTRDELEFQYRECYRILANACGQIPYDPELYYRIASLQYLRAEEDGDRTKYKDAINYLKKAIASDSSHLESYHLIAMAYERLGDKERAKRFWQLFETIYEIAPMVMGKNFITPEREKLHQEAIQHLANLGVKDEDE